MFFMCFVSFAEGKRGGILLTKDEKHEKHEVNTTFFECIMKNVAKMLRE
jgi:hypothetical protein